VNLDEIVVELRPRNPWQSIDLGFMLGRKWFVSLYLLWCCISLPVYVGSVALGLSGWIWLFIWWWFKPLYEAPMVYWCSRVFFNQPVTYREALGAAFKNFVPLLFSYLSIARLGPARSRNMNVIMLEGLKGRERSRRMDVLGSNDRASWLIIVCVHIEIILIYSIVLLAFYMMPEQFRRGFNFLEFLDSGPDHWMDHTLNILTVFCAGLVAPFFVSAGFVLYINRRTHLEGWDIELQFRRMLERLQSRYEGSAKTSSALIGMFVGLFFLTAVDTAQAQQLPSVEESNAAIEQILDHEDFGGEKTERVLRYVGEDRESKSRKSRSGSQIAGWIEGFLWILSITVGVVFLVHILRNAGPLKEMFRNLGFRRQKEEPVVMFNLDISPDSLPRNLAATAMQLAKDGQHRAALSLLYRGSLSRLVHERGMTITASATEQQCLDKVLHEQSEPLASYFAELTNNWLRSAYARKQVDTESVLRLCDEWPAVFDISSAPASRVVAS